MMAKLPDAYDLGERPHVQPSSGVASYSPTNVGAGLSNELRGAGREMQDAALIVDATNAEQDRIAAEAAMNALQQKRVDLEFNPQAGFRNKKEGQAVGQPFVDGYMGQFNDAQKSIADGLQNDRQRKLFAERAPVVSLQYRSALMQHQAQQTEAFNDSTANNTITLALRGMAQRPTDEVGFQTGMLQINATLDDFGRRKGLPKEQIDALKGQQKDAAYSARIIALLDGVPGVTPSNPYLAEQMFRQVAPQLGPQTLLTLSKQVLAGIKDVQMRDGARAEVYGSGSMDARSVYPAIEGVKPLQRVVEQLESAGKRYGPDGQLLTSSKGAQGEMQVMPATVKDPGFGVTPAKDTSPEEIARVGRDYVGAMTARYGSPELVLAAYNAGPGQVDQWIAKYGDPRTGQISTDDWVKKIPFAETQKYVTEGLKKVSAQSGNTAPVSGPTVNQLKAEALPALLERARSNAEAMYPNDPRFVDGYVARTLQNANQVLAAQTAKQNAAADTLTRALVGSKGDGSDGAKTIEQALSDPVVKAAFESATPQAQLAFQDRIARGDKKFDPQSFQIYYNLMGQAGEDPAGFAKVNLAEYYGLIPDEKLVQLTGIQKSINANDAKQQARDLNWARAKANVEDMLRPIGLGSSAKANTSKAKTTEQFYGRFNEALQQQYDATGKWPDTQSTRKIAASLLTEGKESGGLLWDSGKFGSQRLFETEPGKFYVPLPDKGSQRYKDFAASFQKRFGRAGGPVELQQAWTAYILDGGKP